MHREGSLVSGTMVLDFLIARAAARDPPFLRQRTLLRRLWRRVPVMILESLGKSRGSWKLWRRTSRRYGFNKMEVFGIVCYAKSSSNLSNFVVFGRWILQVIYRCRFMAILGVFGSLIGSFLCFIKVYFLY